MEEKSRHSVVTLGFVGDVVLQGKVDARIAGGEPPAALWGDLLPRMRAADAMIGNLEGAITGHARRWPLPKAFYFRAAPKAVEALVAGNFRAMALANNHMLDFRAEGIAETRALLAEAGIAFAGAGRDRAEADEPTVFTAGGRTIGFAAITNTVPAFSATATRAGTAFHRIGVRPAVLDHLRRTVATLRARGAGILILSVHWGPNYRWWPPRHYRAFARAAVEIGFDIVHGHSAHVLQAAEYHRNGLILYDTGDFIEDFVRIPFVPTWQTGLFLVTIAPGEAPRLAFVPATIADAGVRAADPDETVAIRDAMIRRCRGYAVAFREEDGMLVGRPPADGR